MICPGTVLVALAFASEEAWALADTALVPGDAREMEGFLDAPAPAAASRRGANPARTGVTISPLRTNTAHILAFIIPFLPNSALFGLGPVNTKETARNKAALINAPPTLICQRESLQFITNCYHRLRVMEPN
jgi:hypothetical protein